MKATVTYTIEVDVEERDDEVAFDAAQDLFDVYGPDHEEIAWEDEE